MIFDIPKNEPSIIKVLGVGGGGSNAVSFMYKDGIVGVEFGISNTDAQALEVSPVPTKIHLGPTLTEGRGAGSKPQVGKQACLESTDAINEFLGDETKMLFITAGMGGGTGTGAAPVIAQAAREKDILTIGIVTVPFQFEGRRRKELGIAGLEELKKHVDTIVVVSNDKLREMHGDLKISEAFGKADNILATAAKAIAEIITVPGYINVDFEDVNFVMRDSGVAILGNGVADGEGRAMAAIDAALHSPLLEDNNIRGAQCVLVNITSGSKEATMDEISAINDFVQEEAGEGTDLIWGNCYDESLGDALRVTVIATGFQKKAEQQRLTINQEKPKVVNLDERDESNALYALGSDAEPMSIELEAPASRKYSRKEILNMKHTNREPQHNDYDPFEEERNRLKMERMKRMNARRAKAAKPNNIQKDLKSIEDEPAYKRKKVHLDDLKDDETEFSRHTINEQNEFDAYSNNSFLHDNVD